MKTYIKGELAYPTSLLLMACLLSPNVMAEEEDEEDTGPFELSGSVELQYNAIRGDSGHSYGTTFSADVETIYHFSDAVSATASFKIEDAPDTSADADVDEAYLSWHIQPDDKLTLHAGRKSVPFGKHESAMLSDPLPKSLGSVSKNRVLELSTTQNKFSGYAYIFDGTAIDGSKNKRFGTGYGARLAYDGEFAGRPTQVGIDFISNLAEADGFADGRVSRKIPAISLHKSTQWGPVTLRGESTFALKSPKVGDMDGAVTRERKPSAHQIEIEYDLQNERKIAAAWNTTRNSEALGLSKRYVGIAYKQPIYKSIYGGIEIGESKSYQGEKDRQFMLNVGYEF